MRILVAAAMAAVLFPATNGFAQEDGLSHDTTAVLQERACAGVTLKGQATPRGGAARTLDVDINSGAVTWSGAANMPRGSQKIRQSACTPYTINFQLAQTDSMPGYLCSGAIKNDALTGICIPRSGDSAIIDTALTITHKAVAPAPSTPDPLADYYDNTFNVQDNTGVPVRMYYNRDGTMVLVRRTGVHRGTYFFDAKSKTMCLYFVGAPPPDRVGNPECIVNMTFMKLGQVEASRHPDGTYRYASLTPGRQDVLAGIVSVPGGPLPTQAEAPKSK